MKITCVLGSPRPKGSSTTITMRYCDTAEKMGAKVQYFYLDIHPGIEMMFKRHGFKEVRTIRGCGLGGEGEAEKRDDLMKVAEELAEILF